MGYAKYKGALPSISHPSPKYGTNKLFNNGVNETVDDIELLQKLEDSPDFEVKYTAQEIAQLVAKKSVSELKRWLHRSGVDDTRDLSTKTEVVQKIKQLKTIK